MEEPAEELRQEPVEEPAEELRQEPLEERQVEERREEPIEEVIGEGELTRQQITIKDKLTPFLMNDENGEIWIPNDITRLSIIISRGDTINPNEENINNLERRLANIINYKRDSEWNQVDISDIKEIILKTNPAVDWEVNQREPMNQRLRKLLNNSPPIVEEEARQDPSEEQRREEPIEEQRREEPGEEQRREEQRSEEPSEEQRRQDPIEEEVVSEPERNLVNTRNTIPEGEPQIDIEEKDLEDLSPGNFNYTTTVVPLPGNMSEITIKIRVPSNAVSNLKSPGGNSEEESIKDIVTTSLFGGRKTRQNKKNGKKQKKTIRKRYNK
jgi:hypothetical protein